MAIQALCCPHCTGKNLAKHGVNRSGSQRFRCNDCHKTHTPNPNPWNLTPEKQDLILAALNERMSLRAIARAFGVSRDTITALLKKKQTHSPL